MCGVVDGRKYSGMKNSDNRGSISVLLLLSLPLFIFAALNDVIRTIHNTAAAADTAILSEEMWRSFFIGD